MIFAAAEQLCIAPLVDDSGDDKRRYCDANYDRVFLAVPQDIEHQQDSPRGGQDEP